MTPFCFEHEFRAPSIAAVFAAYWNPDHTREQDRRVDILERTVLELEDTPVELRRVCRVVPRRQLPVFVRPLVAGPLHYLETLHWHKLDDTIDFAIRPSILKGRALISARYQLTTRAPGLIHRRYEGTVSVDVALLGSRIERGIVAEFERSMPVAADVTQEWLDRA
jgi:uncharacterized protein DUF2505